MDTDPSMSYGLNIRDKNIEEEKRVGYNPVENVLLKKFKEDMKNLPDDRGIDEFEGVPVEGFGVAILKGYGWKEGQGIGKNAKEDVKMVQYVKRGNKEGLGFQPDKPTFDKKGRELAPKGENGKTRHVIGIDGKLVVRELKGIHVGKVVRVVSGRHVGLKGKVLDKVDSKVVLKLSSDEEVVVGVQEVAELGTVDDKLCVKGLQEEKMRRGGSRDDRRKNERLSYRSEIRDDKKSDRRKHREEKSVNGSSSKKQERSVAVSWLTSHIRVRIISKDYRRGKLYLKKGEVLDVVGPNMCDISLDENKEIIQSVHQDLLETAVPKRGGPVLVLYGKHKGVFGYLVERNMEKETSVVQDADSRELLNVHLEQIAEYLGDPDCIGY
ncbi:hypothetical protein IFM89_011590 [Coptis chinensis]|uniref:G-patch domain-containing protein n=1 Tax=Coptis chinensis TaxID=261450 RepID=A0A835H588_9MAGN|nr:hypothetical protein IFM89_011590 [Coptis chinensis]